MMYTVRLKPSAEKELQRIPKAYAIKIIAALALLAENPLRGKKLEGEYDGQYSFRAWPYRIIYQVYKNELLVIVFRIGHRQGVYR